MKTSHLEQITTYRLYGMTAAVGKLSRAHMEPDLPAIVLESLGLFLSDLEDAGADPFDLEALQQ